MSTTKRSAGLSGTHLEESHVTPPPYYYGPPPAAPGNDKVTLWGVLGIVFAFCCWPLLLVPVLLMLLMPLVPPVGAVPGFGRAAGSADFFDVPRLLPVAVTRPVDTRRVAPARPVTPRFGALRCLFDAFLALDDFELPFLVGM